MEVTIGIGTSDSCVYRTYLIMRQPSRDDVCV